MTEEGGPELLRAQRAVASFDSATGMLRALANHLHGRDTPLLGQLPGRYEPVMSALLGAVNRVPRRLGEYAYATAGRLEAVRPGDTGRVDGDALARWVTGHYPRRRYPVIFVGSSNGALVHLAAALGAPWLPQTLLIPVRRHGVHPDRPVDDLDTLRPAGEVFLRANPGMALHHMHDANQDRLMIAGMSYFRVKWRALPEAYRRFIAERLAPGGTVVVVDCGQRWPITTAGDRYVFQHGAIGGATAEEFRFGGPRVAGYLARYGSPYRRWVAPEPDGTAPEAEWGFAEDLMDDLRGLGVPLARLRFATPHALSPAVADLFRAWYASLGRRTDRLLMSCFLLLDPMLTLRTASVPYWAVFNTEPDLEAAHAYLDAAAPYAEIRAMLFSHGVDSVGLASAADWAALAARGTHRGLLLGVDAAAYPRDFASNARGHRALARVRPTYPVPEPMSLDFAVARLADAPQVSWMGAVQESG